MCSVARKIFFLFFCLSPYVNSFKILTILSSPGRSHFEVFKPMIVELNRRNHSLTVITHFTLNLKEDDNYREMILGDKSGRALHVFEVEETRYEKLSVATIPVRFRQRALGYCSDALSQDAIQKLFRSNDHYDLIMVEFFDNDCFFGFVEKFKAPVIGLSSTAILSWHGDRFGNIDNPAYIPNTFYIASNNMTFRERMENFLVLSLQKLYFNNFNSKTDLFVIEKCFGLKIPSMERLIRNYSSLLLVNVHHSLHFSRPLVPNVVEVGGVHVRERRDLPKNIEKFINESTHGVIYFSLGSMIKGHTFPQEKREEFLRAFARLPQRVLWKWENETMPGKPDNVMIQKWMPQFDILSHPNVKAFISHGGLLGVTEAVHCGVPMMVMPQYGDQHTNAKAVEANGGGVILYLKDATEEKVYENLKTILSPEFKAKASALSERFRDRPMSPMDTAIYWVEYVARHKGAPHLKTAAVDMPLYQYLLLDVLAFLAAIILVVLYISYKITCLIFRALFSKKKVKQN